ncbi:hypothetical protein TNCV_4892751 [Trichonephila clavipes]|nr:hypothetical protein TNCV_4892751 [Trichonephila clavipes]
MLGRRIAARPRPPATVRDLEIALLEEWNSIPQSLIDNLIASMANRCCQGVRHRSQRFVSRLRKSFKTTGMCSRRHGRGRVRSTTPAEDRYIILSAKRNR